MKNLLLTVKTVFLALVPFLLACKVTVASGGALSFVFPPLDTIFTSLPAFASTVVAWFELAVRLVPTARNYSLVDFAFRLVKSLVPNAASSDADPTSTELRFRGGRLVDLHL